MIVAPNTLSRDGGATVTAQMSRTMRPGEFLFLCGAGDSALMVGQARQAALGSTPDKLQEHKQQRKNPIPTAKIQATAGVMDNIHDITASVPRRFSFHVVARAGNIIANMNCD